MLFRSTCHPQSESTLLSQLTSSIKLLTTRYQANYKSQGFLQSLIIRMNGTQKRFWPLIAIIESYNTGQSGQIINRTQPSITLLTSQAVRISSRSSTTRIQVYQVLCITLQTSYGARKRVQTSQSIITTRTSFFKARGRALFKEEGSVTGLHLRLYIILY